MRGRLISLLLLAGACRSSTPPAPGVELPERWRADSPEGNVADALWWDRFGDPGPGAFGSPGPSQYSTETEGLPGKSSI